MIKTAASLFMLYGLSSSQPPPAANPVDPYVPIAPVDPVIPAVPSTTSTSTTATTASTSTTATTSTSTSTTTTTTTTSTTVPPTELGAFGQICAAPGIDTQCKTITDYALDAVSVKCERDYDCCLCSTVQCQPNCNVFTVGNSGISGVQSVLIQGRNIEAGGADIYCKGTEACTNSVIQASNIKAVVCSEGMSCKDAAITVTNPANYFYLECIGMASCQGLKIHVVLPASSSGVCDPSKQDKLKITKIGCSGQASCEGLEFTITNNGCDKVEIESLDCLQHDACTDASFNFIGDVDVATCHCGESCQTVTGIEKCFDGLEYLFCPDPISCRGATRTITNPVDGFILKCSAAKSCQGSTFNIEVSELIDNVDMFDGLMCNGPHACDGATFNIDNRQQTGKDLEIEKIECSSVGSCMDTTFMIGENTNVGQIYCNPGSCTGCVIKTDPNVDGIPCDPSTQIQAVPNSPMPQMPAVLEPVPVAPQHVPVN